MKQYLSLAVAGVLFVAGAWIILKSNGSAKVPTVATTVDNSSILSIIESNTTTASSKTNVDSVSKKQVYDVTLNDSNTVILTGAIGEQSISVAQEITSKSKRGPIFLLINSPGGSVLDGVQIVSAVQAATHPVYTVCLQICASMASIIFEMGTKRLMVDRSVLMFHEAAGGLQGPFNQMKTRLNFFNRFVNKMDYEIATRIGLDPDVFRSQLANEIWLDAEDSIKQNYADKLVNVNIQGLATHTGPEERIKSQNKALKEKVDINF